MLSYGQSTTPPAIKYLLIVTFAVYVLQILPGTGGLLLRWGALIPILTFRFGQVWRLATYLLLHSPGSPFHILFNMLALWMFGIELEQRWGAKRFIFFYLLCGIGAGLFNLFNMVTYASALTPIIGASGAVLGLLTAYAWYYPDRRVLVFFVFPLPVRWAVVLFGAMSLLLAVQGGGGPVAHLTHLGGILVALLYLRYHKGVEGRLEALGEARRHAQTQHQHEEVQRRRSEFEQNIDPLLEKISRQGMDSLTPDERKQLFAASRRQRSQFHKRGIIPFDFGERQE